jgi:hypothetical protein
MQPVAETLPLFTFVCLHFKLCVALSCTMLSSQVTRSSLLRGAGCLLAVPSTPHRRTAVMASVKKSVLVPIGNGSEEMEAVICEQ